MTVQINDTEAHLLRTILGVEHLRATTVTYADEIRPLSKCIEGLLRKLTPRVTMRIRIKTVTEAQARRIDARLRKQGIL